MDKRIVLATAGSGKTYYIANSFCENSRVLLLSFTNRNVDNIRQEIVKRFSEIPADVKIHTFDSFIYNFLIIFNYIIVIHIVYMFFNNIIIN